MNTFEALTATDWTHGTFACPEDWHVGSAPLFTVFPAVSANATVDEKQVVVSWVGCVVVYLSVTVRLPENPESVTAAAGATCGSQLAILSGPTNRSTSACAEPIGPVACSSWNLPTFFTDFVH